MGDKKTLEQLTKETVEQGGVFAVLYFDMHAKEEENLKNIATDFVGRITKEPGVLYAQGEIEAPTKGSDEVYSTNAQVYVLTQTLTHLAGICMRFGPIGVELLKPEDRLTLSLGEVHDLLLLISQNSFEFSRFVMSRVAKKEDWENFIKAAEKRAEMGKRLRERKDDKEVSS
ncbi:hypothetical protein DRN67_03010 [Candidatus Micrarchaeota archaeon]|nr:MAG: hypothetical protein DRN67_03010 [Candidatus Micrarchaeota archaeon]